MVKQQRGVNKTKNKSKKNGNNKDREKTKGFVVLLYVSGLSERISRTMKQHNLGTYFKAPAKENVKDKILAPSRLPNMFL